MDAPYEFRAWDETQNYMAYQGSPDLETIQSFMHHFGDKPLMLYSGVLDKHGKKIFQSDVVKCEYGIGKVIFKSGCLWVQWLDSDDVYMEWVFSRKGTYIRKDEDELEVIGNIYESNINKLILEYERR